MSRHADTAWRIQERGAPSPRAYLQLVNAWIRQVRAALRQMVRATHADATAEEEEARRRQALLFGIQLNQPNALPDPPDEQQVDRAIKAAAKQAMRAARSGLIAAGLPRGVMESRLLIPSGPEDLLTGIDIAPTVQDREILRVWARNGTDLIKTVGQELVAGLDEHVVEWARSGASTRSLAEVVMERLGVAERHAQFIARDQIAKLNSALTESTQQAAGVTRYRWRSSNDQRTRPMHLALDGSVQSWGDPPVTSKDGARNHPGEDYQCRCVAIPIIEGIDDDTPRAPKERRAPIARNPGEQVPF